MSEAFAFGGRNRQRELLLNEGVPFLNDGRVDLKRCMVGGLAQSIKHFSPAYFKRKEYAGERMVCTAVLRICITKR